MAPCATSPANVVPLTNSEPPPVTATPPPSAAAPGVDPTAWSLLTTSLVSVSVPPWTSRPPPSVACPPLIVRPEIVTLADGEVMSKTRLSPPASTSSEPAPGP